MFHDSRIPAEPTLSPARNTGGPGSKKKKKNLKLCLFMQTYTYTHQHTHVKEFLTKIHESGDTFTDAIQKLNHLPA